jgi:HEAT repeat protein
LIWVWQFAGDEGRRRANAAVSDLDNARNPRERMQAIQALLQSGLSESGLAIPPLVRLLRDPDADVRVEAARALGPATSAAARSGANEPARAAIRAVLESLNDPQPSVRTAGVTALGSIAATQNSSPEIVPRDLVAALAEMLRDPDATVRVGTIGSLGLAGPVAAADPPEGLIAALNDEANFNRTAAASALSRFERGYDLLVPVFAGTIEKIRVRSGDGTDKVNDDDSALRTICLQALRRMRGKLSAAAVPAVIAALKNRDREARYEAVALLQALGPDARAAVPALIDVLKRDPIDEQRLGRGDPNADAWDPGSKAAHALVAIAGNSESVANVVVALTDAVRSGHPERRHAAAVALPSCRPKTAVVPAIPALIQMLRDSDTISYGYDIGTVAAMALGGLAPGTPSADEAIAALTAALGAERKRFAVINALARFGPAARSAVPQLKRLKDQDPNANIRRDATTALAEIEASASKP